MIMTPEPRFKVGDWVIWTESIPPTWRYIYTNKPMRVIDVVPHSGGGRCDIKSGWIYTVAYGPDSEYYDPDYRFLDGKKVARMTIHEMWLTHKVE